MRSGPDELLFWVLASVLNTWWKISSSALWNLAGLATTGVAGGRSLVLLLDGL